MSVATLLWQVVSPDFNRLRLGPWNNLSKSLYSISNNKNIQTGNQMSKDNFKFKHTLRVRWKECDVQGIAYYGSYLDFIDVAQAEYFRSLGILTHHPEKRETFDLAAVKVILEYKSPAKIDELIDVFFRVEKIGNSSLDKRSEIYQSGTEKLLCSGQLISVNFDSDLGTSRNVPSEIKDIIEKFESTGQEN